jgi:hypothetical protein
MKKSNFFAGIMFLAAAATFSLAFAQSGLQYAIVTSNSGELVGQLSGAQVTFENNGTPTTTPTSTSTAVVPVYTYTSLPPGVPTCQLTPAVTATQTVVNVKVPYSSPVAFCSSGNYYNKSTGLCADGKFPYKIVPAGSLSDPAAQTPNVVCRAPMVPTYNPAMKKWLCIVPTGFKVSLGE